MKYVEVASRTAHLIRLFDPEKMEFPPEAAEELRAFGRDCRKLDVFRRQEAAGRKRFEGMTAGQIWAQLEDYIRAAPDWESRLTMVVTVVPFAADALK